MKVRPGAIYYIIMSVSRAYFSKPAAVLRFGGEDHATFLQGQGTADLRGPAGLCRYHLLLDHKGRIQGDGYILKLNSEAMLLVSYATPADELLARFERYVIADDVTIVDQTDSFQLISLRPESESEDVIPRPPQGGFITLAKGYAWQGRRLGLQTVDMLIPSDTAWEAALTRIDAPAAESSRIADGIPLVPQDTVAGLTPVEAGIISAVSFDKGCYLGQEVVARTHRLQRGTRRLVRFAGLPANIVPPVALTLDGQVVGEVTSACSGSSHTGPGLGWLKARIGPGQYAFAPFAAKVEDLDPS